MQWQLLQGCRVIGLKEVKWIPGGYQAKQPSLGRRITTMGTGED